MSNSPEEPTFRYGRNEGQPLLGRRQSNSSKTAGTPVSAEDHHACGHTHYSHRGAWLRAMILGANDGLVTISCLILGVASAELVTPKFVILSALSGLVAGSLSMACGEYISVSSQRDTEEADVEKERLEQLKGPAAQHKELLELAEIYEQRGLSKETAMLVATELTENNDVVRVHARDELGIDIDNLSNPFLAAVTSCISFFLGGLPPMLVYLFLHGFPYILVYLWLVSITTLLVFGVVGALLGGSSVTRGAVRVAIGGSLSMTLTYFIGSVFDKYTKV